MLSNKSFERSVEKILTVLFLIIFAFTLVSIKIRAQNGWTKKADIPTPRVGSSACVINDKIYVLGGINSSYSDIVANETYDPLTNKWEVKQPLPTPRGYLSTAVVNGIIYAIGCGYPTSKKKLEAYDPGTDAWTTKADMLGNRRGARAGVGDGIIYNIGGNYSERNCEAYDPNTNTWTSKTPMPGAGGMVSATVYDGLIYVFGGGYYGSYKSVYVYNPLTDTWIQKQSMPTARFAFQTYLVDGKIYAVGGSQGEGNTLATVEVYDPVNDTWETKPNMPFKSCMFAGAVVNSKIYVIGGTSDWATGGNEIWEYDPNAPFNCSPNVINFGNILVGTSSNTISITIENIGLQSFSITSITHNQNEFSLLNLPSFPITLAPLTSIQFGVSFHPNNHGKINDEVVVSTDNTQYSTLTIPLEGLGILFGPQFQLFVDRVDSAPYLDRTEIVDSFLNKYTIMPLIEQDTICQFLYQGEAGTINLASDANLWNVNASPLIKLSTTNLWYYSDVFESDARIDYKFVIDGNNWILDPKNPKTCLGGYGPNSELAMPDYVYAPEINFYSEIEHGKLNDTTFYSSILGNSRRVVIYIPYLYNSVGLDSFSVALFHDGSEWINFASAKNTLDYLIHHKLIQPLIAVFVDPVNRDLEYIGDQKNQFTEFIATELMPFIDANYRTRLNPKNRATLGVSNGGNIALHILSRHPEMFENAASFSGSILSATAAAFESGIPKSIKLYIDVGTYDLPGFIDLSRGFKDITQTQGYDHLYNEWHEGHSWGSWKAHLDLALEFIFPGEAVDVEDVIKFPINYSLSQNYPNPFNPSTKIKYSIPNVASDFSLSNATLKIYDILGREIATLVSQTQKPGSYEVEWNAEDLSSGVYFYQLKAGEFTETKKMILLR